MFTSAVGFGEHHFLGVDKSQCPPYEKSLIESYAKTNQYLDQLANRNGVESDREH
jgi:hypothetical protein